MLSWAHAHIIAVVSGIGAFMATFLLSMLTAHQSHDVIVIAAGAEGGAYHRWAIDYAEALRRAALRAEVLTTSGAVENLRLIHAGTAQVALMQGGVLTPADRSDLESLGTIAYEPLWLWARGIAAIGDLAGKTVAIGAAGSGTQVLARLVLAQYGLDQTAQLRELSSTEARMELEAGRLDAAMMVASIDSPDVQALLAEPAVALIGDPHADAYVAVSPALHHVVLPAGARNLARGEPAQPVDLLAAKAGVAVRQDLNSSVKYLLLQTMREIHAQVRMFTKANEFPAAETIGLELSDVAKEFYAGQLGLVYRLLPFWLADLAGLIIASAIPAIALIYPLLLLAYKMRRAQLAAGQTKTPGLAPASSD